MDGGSRDSVDFVKLICSCCDFYKESDEGLECGAFKILRYFIQNGKISLEEVYTAKNEVCESQE
ncbi:MAG: hypothetical protein R6U44_12440 [Archaeoglobaceae archaeon]